MDLPILNQLEKIYPNQDTGAEAIRKLVKNQNLIEKGIKEIDDAYDLGEVKEQINTLNEHISVYVLSKIDGGGTDGIAKYKIGITPIPNTNYYVRTGSSPSSSATSIQLTDASDNVWVMKIQTTNTVDTMQDANYYSFNAGSIYRVFFTSKNGVNGCVIPEPSYQSLDVKNKVTTLASGVFRAGDTITLASNASNFNKLILISGDGLGSPNPITIDTIYPYKYPSNFSTDVDYVFGGTNYSGQWKITLKAGGKSIEVTSLNGAYIRSIHGIKGGI